MPKDVHIATTRIIRVDDPTCPSCSTKLDAATSVEGAVPKPGDLSVCVECGEVLQFTNDFSLERMPEEVWDQLPKKQQEFLRMTSDHFRKRRN